MSFSFWQEVSARAATAAMNKYFLMGLSSSLEFKIHFAAGRIRALSGVHVLGFIHREQEASGRHKERLLECYLRRGRQRGTVGPFHLVPMFHWSVILFLYNFAYFCISIVYEPLRIMPVMRSLKY